MMPNGAKDVNEALMRAPDALVREVERVRQQLFDPLQHAWVFVHNDELGFRPMITVKKAQARRRFGTLGSVESGLLDKATTLAESIRAQQAIAISQARTEAGLPSRSDDAASKKSRGRRH